ncbi:MAG: TetR/AcrR family transcriptional regulator [Clostridia bacterium]|nr:TetR/AcrR family transcriptional regulator [Clostridia bacterium]
MGYKGKSTEERIKKEAMKLFLERGYKDVSMQDICNATGLSKGGLYRHFSSKSEILLSLVEDERKADVSERIACREPAVQILTDYLDLFYRNMLMSDQSLAYALFEYASMEKDNSLMENSRTDSSLWKELIEYGVETGAFNAIDYRMVMNTLLFAYRGIRLWSRAVDIGEEIPESIVEAVKLLVIKGYRREESK